jgi:glycerophosphoryl diester phosphodiesterase
MSVTLVLAHRGSRFREPENTVSAFARAVSEGADGVELDVHRTRDDALVVCHDGATPAGVVSEMTLAEVQRAFPLVPTLGECLDVTRGTLVNIEIKNLPTDADWDPADRAAELVVEALAQRQGARGPADVPDEVPDEVPDDVVVSSFNLTTVDKVRSLAPHVPTALLSMVGFDPLEALVVAEQHGHGGLHPDARSIVGAVGGALLMRARDHGVAIRPWTVNDPAEVARLAALGVDAVITDDPVVALVALGR